MSSIASSSHFGLVAQFYTSDHMISTQHLSLSIRSSQIYFSVTRKSNGFFIPKRSHKSVHRKGKDRVISNIRSPELGVMQVVKLNGENLGRVLKFYKVIMAHENGKGEVSQLDQGDFLWEKEDPISM